MSVYLSKASPYYRFDFVDRGVRFHGSTKQKNKRKAEQVEKQERERVKYTPLLDRTGPVCLEIEAIAQDFAHAVSRHYADDSAAWRDLKRLVKYFGRETLLSHITDVQVADLVAWRRTHRVNLRRKLMVAEVCKPVSRTTVNRSTIEPLRRLFTYAKRELDVKFRNEPNWKKHMHA